MSIITYAKAHIFHSTDSMFKVAESDNRKIDWAQSAIASKLKKAESRHHDTSALKYNNILNKLSILRGNDAVGHYKKINEDGVVSIDMHAMPSREHANIRDELRTFWKSQAEPQSAAKQPQIQSQRGMDQIKNQHDMLNSAEFLRGHTQTLKGHCDFILDINTDETKMLARMRYVTTSLQSFMMLRDPALKAQAEAFLNLPVGDKLLTACGDMKTCPPEDLLQLKSLIQQISGWASDTLEHLSS
nr:hypothetical protein [uncultured Enterobacter sp.]